MKLTPLRKSWLFASLSLLVVAYMVAAWLMTASASDSRLCQGVLITVHDTSEIHFVTPQELSAELGDLPQYARVTKLKDIDIDSIERMLSLFDKIERVNVNKLSSGKIHIDVWPMRPVARIFDTAGHSYYINRAGKKIAAQPGYFLDVPVIQGNFSAGFEATSLIPLVDYIENDPVWRDAISMIEARSPSDIILVPVIRGHVINIGDSTDFPDKFRRLKLMYSKVMGVKGWDFYKEISVKWRGQVVGIRRDTKQTGPEYMHDEQNDEEAADVTTAELDDGIKTPIKADTPIPAAKNRTEPLTAKKEKSEEKKRTDSDSKKEKEKEKEKDTKHKNKQNG